MPGAGPRPPPCPRRDWPEAGRSPEQTPSARSGRWGEECSSWHLPCCDGRLFLFGLLAQHSTGAGIPRGGGQKRISQDTVANGALACAALSKPPLPCRSLSLDAPPEIEISPFASS